MKSMGFYFPKLQELFERLEETIKIAKHIWGCHEGAYKGKYYELAEPMNSPKPISEPHPPILIGGAERKERLG